MACTDMHWLREARQAWQLARRMADRSGDPSTQLWVHGNEITLGIYQGRPLSAVVAAADRAATLPQKFQCPGRAELLAGKAQVFAMLGQRADAITVLRQAEATFACLSEGITSDSDSIFGWHERRLRHAESFVLARVGSATNAGKACDRALTMYSATRVISKAQIEMHRAFSLVRRGDLDEGVGLASVTLQSMPAEKRRRLVLRIASDILTAAPESEQTRPQLAEYRALLRDYAGSVDNG
jgi:hypothetical protein